MEYNHSSDTGDEELDYIETDRRLQAVFHEMKVRIGEYYECPDVLSRLELTFIESSNGYLLPKLDHNTLTLGYDQIEELVDELACLEIMPSEERTERMILGVGLTSVVARSSFLDRYSDDSRVDDVSGLTNYFANHNPIETAFHSIFIKDFSDRASMTFNISDSLVMQINGLRYCLRLLNDVYKDSPDYAVLPSSDQLCETSRSRIWLLYNNRADLYYKASLSLPKLSFTKGDEMFFESLSPWLIAMSCPMGNEELRAIEAID